MYEIHYSFQTEQCATTRWQGDATMPPKQLQGLQMEAPLPIPIRSWDRNRFPICQTKSRNQSGAESGAQSRSGRQI